MDVPPLRLLGFWGLRLLLLSQMLLNQVLNPVQYRGELTPGSAALGIHHVVALTDEYAQLV